MAKLDERELPLTAGRFVELTETCDFPALWHFCQTLDLDRVDRVDATAPRKTQSHSLMDLLLELGVHIHQHPLLPSGRATVNGRTALIVSTKRVNSLPWVIDGSRTANGVDPHVNRPR
jgi:hypothetical protein